MKSENRKIIASDKSFTKLLRKEIHRLGPNANLNHIDTSKITKMTRIFYGDDEFDGDISEWDTSSVVDMSYAFGLSVFNGDISNWNTANVIHMDGTFANSKFKGDISQWNTKNVLYMNGLFCNAEFNGDISQWDFSNVVDANGMFEQNLKRSSFSNIDISRWQQNKQIVYDGWFLKMVEQSHQFKNEYEASILKSTITQALKIDKSISL